MDGWKFVTLLIALDGFYLVTLGLVLRSDSGRAWLGRGRFTPAQVIVGLTMLRLASDIGKAVVFHGDQSLDQLPAIEFFTDSALFALVALGFWRR